MHDNDRSPASRAADLGVCELRYFDLVADRVEPIASTRRLIDRGDVRAVLVIPPGLERDLLSGQRVPVQVIINGDNSNTAATVMGYALRVLQTVSAQYQVAAVASRRRRPSSRRAARLVQPASFAARCSSSPASSPTSA